VSQQINLFNPILLKQKRVFSSAIMAKGLGVILLGMVLLFVFAQYQAVKLKGLVAETAKRLETEQGRLTTVAAEFAPGRESQRVEEDIARLGTQLAARQKLLDVLQGGELGNTAGFSVYFSAFSRQAIDGLWLTGFSIHGAGNQMVIDGRATRPELVPAYIKRLNREPAMQGKSFASMEISLPAPAKAANSASKDAPVPQPRFVEFRLLSKEREAAK